MNNVPVHQLGLTLLLQGLPQANFHTVGQGMTDTSNTCYVNAEIAYPRVFEDLLRILHEHKHKKFLCRFLANVMQSRPCNKGFHVLLFHSCCYCCRCCMALHVIHALLTSLGWCLCNWSRLPRQVVSMYAKLWTACMKGFFHASCNSSLPSPDAMRCRNMHACATMHADLM